MRNDACLTDEELAAFHLGEFPEPILDAIRKHQESCPSCERRAQQFDDQTDAVLATLRRSASKIKTTAGTSVWDPHLTTGFVGNQENLADRPSQERPEWSRNGTPVDRTDRPPPRLPDYEVGEFLLGKGGMGVVYKARHLKLNRIVALKMMAGNSSKYSAIFQIEAKAVAQLQHPNIVQIFEIGDHEGQPFLALEFVDGGSLEAKIAGKPQPPRRAAETLHTLALAADYAHRQGIVHCDLKPSNILITPDGVLKLTDFGVAKWGESNDHWQQDGNIIGTPRYMAPEQASGRNNHVGPATDIYSLGVILYEMLTGRTPHHSANSFETLTLVCEQEPVPPRKLQPRLPRDLETIVLKCLRKEPAKRYSDAKALAEDLERFLAGKPILARPIGLAERSLKWAKRHQMVSSLLLVTTLWLTVTGLILWRYHTTLQLYYTELKSAGLIEPKSIPGNHPETVSQAIDGSIRLNASAAAIYGSTLTYENHFGNLGYWHSSSDRAVWTFRVKQSGTFSLNLEFSCSDDTAGNLYEIRVGKSVTRGIVGTTGSFANYRTFFIREISLPRGTQRLEVCCVGTMNGALFDLKAATLVPTNHSSTMLPLPKSHPSDWSKQFTQEAIFALFMPLDSIRKHETPDHSIHLETPLHLCDLFHRRGSPGAIVRDLPPEALQDQVWRCRNEHTALAAGNLGM